MRQNSLHETLGEMRAEIAARLGYSAQGTQSAVLTNKLNYYLKDAQEQLLYQFDDMLRKGIIDDKVVNSGQVLYDIDPAAEVDTVQELFIWFGARWLKMIRGIPFEGRDSVTTSVPTHWEIRLGTTGQGQFEIWPPPGDNYKLGYEYQAVANNFTDDSDRSTVPSRLVLLMALGNAMDDYGKKGAEKIMRQVDMMLQRLRARQNRGIIVRAGMSYSSNPCPFGDVEFVAKQAEFIAP